MSEEKTTIPEDKNVSIANYVQGTFKEFPRPENKPTLNLYKAILEVQKEVFLVKKETKNTFFNSTYSDLATISKVARPALSKNGLILIQEPVIQPLGAGCLTRLIHVESGEEIRNLVVLPFVTRKFDKYKGTWNDEVVTAQDSGSLISYAKRYSFSAIIGIVTEDEDDDGNKGSNKKKDDPAPPENRKPANKPGTPPKPKDAPIAPVATQPLKVPLSEDNIPDAYTTTKQVFPDSQEIKINFKYDIDQCPADKIPTIEKYLNEMEKQGYVYLDQGTGVIESEIELPKLKNYQTNLT